MQLLGRCFPAAIKGEIKNIKHANLRKIVLIIIYINASILSTDSRSLLTSAHIYTFHHFPLAKLRAAMLIPSAFTPSLIKLIGNVPYQDN